MSLVSNNRAQENLPLKFSILWRSYNEGTKNESFLKVKTGLPIKRLHIKTSFRSGKRQINDNFLQMKKCLPI